MKRVCNLAAEPFLEAAEHASLDRLSRDALAVAAGALGPVSSAAIPALADDGVSCSIVSESAQTQVMRRLPWLSVRLFRNSRRSIITRRPECSARSTRTSTIPCAFHGWLSPSA
jgi:hypothetical protein